MIVSGDTHTRLDLLERPGEIESETHALCKAPFSTAEEINRAKGLVRTLAVAHTNASLYPATHPLVADSLEELRRSVAGVIALGFDSVAISLHRSTLFIENQVFPEESVTYRKLFEELLARGVSAIRLLPTFSLRDAQGLVDLVAEHHIVDMEAAVAFLDERGAIAVEVFEAAPTEQTEDEARAREFKAAIRKDYEAGLSAMRDVEMRTKLGRVFEVTPLQSVVSSMLDNVLHDPAAVLGLTAIKNHDEYTLSHSINVSILSLSLGAALGMDDDSLHSLGLSAMLFDLGKVRVPEAILAKEGPLTSEEWNAVRSHAEEGADLLKRIQLVDQMPMVVAFEHHQRHDLSGYPAPAGTQEQHLFSKIVAICDAYDAMTTRRPFRREIRPDKALAVLMQGRGKAYDPDVVKAFVTLLGIFPIGAVVVLENRDVGVVYRVNNDDLLRPRVKVLIDSEGRWLDEPAVLDLRLVDPETGMFAMAVSECVPAADAGVDDVWQYL